jgi:hypothetical protein
LICEIGADLDAAAVMLDAGLVQTQAVDIGEAANGHQHVGAVDDGRRPLSLS